MIREDHDPDLVRFRIGTPHSKNIQSDKCWNTVRQFQEIPIRVAKADEGNQFRVVQQRSKRHPMFVDIGGKRDNVGAVGLHPMSGECVGMLRTVSFDASTVVELNRGCSATSSGEVEFDLVHFTSFSWFPPVPLSPSSVYAYRHAWKARHSGIRTEALEKEGLAEEIEWHIAGPEPLAEVDKRLISGSSESVGME